MGVGSTPYYKRGRSVPQTPLELAGKAMLAAVEDAGLTIDDVDGLALYSMGLGGDTSLFAQMIGIPEVRFTATLTGGGGGAAGSVGLAAAAIASGMATCVVSLMTLQQAASRFGASYAPRGKPGAQYSAPPSPEGNFIQPAGLMGPGPDVRGAGATGTCTCTARSASTSPRSRSRPRENARRRETSIMRDEMTLDDYFAARMIAEPLCLFDFCLECDGAVAVVTTTRRARRATCVTRRRTCARPRTAGTVGGARRSRGWGCPTTSSRRRGTAPSRSASTRWPGLGPDDVDVALLYDHFSPMVVLQLEDYGFCSNRRGRPVRRVGRDPLADRLACPVNTHGGNLSEAYIIGMTHVKEAVEQIRGTAVNQVDGAGGRARDRGSGVDPGQLAAAHEGDRLMAPGTRRVGELPPEELDPADARRVHAAVLGRGARAPPRRAPLHQLRHVPAPAEPRSAGAASAQDGRVGRAAGPRHRLQLHGRVAPPAARPRRLGALRAGCRRAARHRRVQAGGRDARRATWTDVHIGMDVELVWRDVREGETVPTWRPV